MVTVISNSGSDERGKSTGGKAGDQTGREWRVQNWYSSPWFCVLRYPDEEVRNTFARLARDAANNNMIGYDQSQRTSFWGQLEKSGYEPSKITTPCEADCSAGVVAIIKATGYQKCIKKLMDLPESLYTGNLRSYLVNAGFTCLTEEKYLKSDEYLLPGDVLLHDNKHTAFNLDRGAKAGGNETVNVDDITVLKKGIECYEARTFQRIINSLGIKDQDGRSLVVDGKYGGRSVFCARAFQRSVGLEDDGVVGKATWTKLIKG